MLYGRARRLKYTCRGETARSQANIVDVSRPTHERAARGMTTRDARPATRTGRRSQSSDSPTVSDTALSKSVRGMQ